jgi:hypothetical protein
MKMGGTYRGKRWMLNEWLTSIYGVPLSEVVPKTSELDPTSEAGMLSYKRRTL